ncbi:hypothetical protein ACFSB1_11070 [Halopseudomonas phragmitis]|uniref:Uncharacterized protein n=1 Tax=Halopseudomonas phragmitis TaxID=1931241 RepID=A0A1V0BA06_9GAMM|nr:hypothetical protein [Halopseudomonas phragmitis]AQZ96624.1 hypothetical protein BVH74_18520 [Halopseudomonas phragmitis]
MSTVNPWKRFIGLLPGGSRAVGTVASVSLQTGTSIITLRNGNQISAKGTSVGQGLKALVVDGRVVGSVPSLPQYDVEV